MDKPVLQNAHQSITREELGAFERQKGVRIPDRYVDFLLRQNGGRYWQDVVWLPPQQGGKHHCINVNDFYALNSPFDYDDLAWNFEALRPYIAPNHMPFASDGCGDSFCLLVEDSKDYGTVWIWDHELSWEKGLEWVAPSFEAFLNGIVYDPDADWQETISAFSACERGDVDVLIRLERDGLDPDLRNSDGETLLMAGAGWRQPRILEHLLKAKPELEVTCPRGRTAFWCAANGSSLDCTRLILDAGAEIDVPDKDGNTPLLAAVNCSAIRTALLLVDIGANVNLRNRFGYTPLRICKESDRDRILTEALLNAGAVE